jgi:hypothetical protein
LQAGLARYIADAPFHRNILPLDLNLTSSRMVGHVGRRGNGSSGIWQATWISRGQRSLKK